MLGTPKKQASTWGDWLLKQVPIDVRLWTIDQWDGEDLRALWYATQVLRYFITGKMYPFVEYVIGSKIDKAAGLDHIPVFVWAILPFAQLKPSESCILLMKCIESCNSPEKFMSHFNPPGKPILIKCPTKEEFESTASLVTSRIAFGKLTRNELEGMVMSGRMERSMIPKAPKALLCKHRSELDTGGLILC